MKEEEDFWDWLGYRWSDTTGSRYVEVDSSVTHCCPTRGNRAPWLLTTKESEIKF